MNPQLDVFFSRPGTNKVIVEEIIKDIRGAKERILVAMAYFTDKDIWDELDKKALNEKKIVLNASDILRRENNQKKTLLLERSKGEDTVLLGTITKDNRGKDKSTHMHHKFLVIDDVVWVGSYNFTLSARDRHWENMIRIQNKQIADEFKKEFYNMFLLGKMFNGNNILTHEVCTECNHPIVDPFEHFVVQSEICSVYIKAEHMPEREFIGSTFSTTFHCENSPFNRNSFKGYDYEVCGCQEDNLVPILYSTYYDEGSESDLWGWNDFETKVTWYCPSCYMEEAKRQSSSLKEYIYNEDRHKEY
ncbi:phospholipase D-like domain-containing protein [Peribacillus frigoritolerans]|uniref:phospholipase D-like domain-containing protein n=1 Tax=Peribacillus frigoritolerans TaxID=450367 RepID=UPI00315CC982